MYQCASTDNGIIVNFHLSSNLGSITNDNIIMQYAVVSDVRISHDQAILAYNGFTF